MVLFYHKALPRCGSAGEHNTFERIGRQGLAGYGRPGEGEAGGDDEADEAGARSSQEPS